MSDERKQLFAVLGSGFLSPILDSADVRQPRRLSDTQFDLMVKDLYEQGRCVIPDSEWVQ